MNEPTNGLDLELEWLIRIEQGNSIIFEARSSANKIDLESIGPKYAFLLGYLARELSSDNPISL